MRSKTPPHRATYMATFTCVWQENRFCSLRSVPFCLCVVLRQKQWQVNGLVLRCGFCGYDILINLCCVALASELGKQLDTVPCSNLDTIIIY